MIRKMLKTDIDTIMNIWLQTNCLAHDFIDENYWQENFDFVKQALNNADIFVFQEENIIKGFIGIIDNYIAGLFVFEKFQHKGIGLLLLKECKKKYPFLSLDVFVKNTKAVSFYKKNGFAIKETKINEDTKEEEYNMFWQA